MSLLVNRLTLLLLPHQKLGQSHLCLGGWSGCLPCNQDTASTAQKKLLILLLERFALAGRDASQVGGNSLCHLANATLEHFSSREFGKKLLVPFIQVQETTGTREKAAFDFSLNKGSLNDVKEAIASKEQGKAYNKDMLD
jgi:hypothetical protein